MARTHVRVFYYMRLFWDTGGKIIPPAPKLIIRYTLC